MKIVDRYLIKQFLSTIIFSIVGFTALFVIIDMMENLDDFIDQNVNAFVILKYYGVFVPEIIKLMMPVAILFSSLFTSGKMSTSNELTALKASGVSFYRFMTPLVLLSFLFSVGLIYFGGYVVPLSNKTKVELELKYLNRGHTQMGRNIFFQDSPTRTVRITFFDESRLDARGVSIQEFSPEDLTVMIERIDAEHMLYDTLDTKWVVLNGTYRKFEKDGQKLEYFSALDLDTLNFRPKDLALKQLKTQEMNLDELEQAIQDQRDAGYNPNRLLIEYHSRYAFAMTGFIVVLFGLPLSANNRKAGMALQFGINILITFVYMGIMQITQAFGKNGALNPILTAWLVNIIFFVAALINLVRVRR